MEPKKILVVDDDQDLTNLIKIRLEAFGYEVTVANDGEEAIESIHRSCPVAIILDLEMPEKNGLATLSELKQKFNIGVERDGSKSHVPVIVLTGLIGDAIEKVVQDTGVFDYVRKPFNCEVLADKLEKAIASLNS